MLNEYFQLGNRISKHYVSPGVILCLVTGRFVPPIHRKNLYSLQYSMLPAQRVGISELWRQLTEKAVRSEKEFEFGNGSDWSGGHVRKGSNGLNRRGFGRSGGG
jgi:phosphatidylinositol glycan class Q protein